MRNLLLVYVRCQRESRTGSSAAPSDHTALAATSGEREGSVYSKDNPATAVGAVRGVGWCGSSLMPEWLVGICIDLEERVVVRCDELPMPGREDVRKGADKVGEVEDKLKVFEKIEGKVSVTPDVGAGLLCYISSNRITVHPYSQSQGQRLKLLSRSQ